MLGFAFDTSNVADQLTACIEIYNRYKAELLTGTLDPEEQVAAMMEEMRSNGFDGSLPRLRLRSTLTSLANCKR